jgi:hypothetical protein
LAILETYEHPAPGRSVIVKLYPLDQDCMPIYLIKSGDAVYSSRGLMFSGHYNIKQPGDINKKIYLYIIGDLFSKECMTSALASHPDAQVVKIKPIS